MVGHDAISFFVFIIPKSITITITMIAHTLRDGDMKGLKVIFLELLFPLLFSDQLVCFSFSFHIVVYVSFPVEMYECRNTKIPKYRNTEIPKYRNTNIYGKHYVACHFISLISSNIIPTNIDPCKFLIQRSTLS